MKLFLSALFLISGIYFLGINNTTMAAGINPALLQNLLRNMSKNSEDALKHGDEVLKKYDPNLENKPIHPNPRDKLTPSPPASTDGLNLGSAAGRGTARTHPNCYSSENFSKPTETLVVTGNDVNIRSCGSTSCSVISRANKGRYTIDAITRQSCWIKFRFKNSSGVVSTGYIHELYALIE
jgi:hypothetical protein